MNNLTIINFAIRLVGPINEGTLTIIASGSASAMDAAQPALEAMSMRVLDCGSSAGAGSPVKMANQMLVGVHAVAAAEALDISRAGLKARARPGLGGMVQDERHFLHALEDSIETGQTPADELLERYNGEWQGDLRRIYAEYSY